MKVQKGKVDSLERAGCRCGRADCTQQKDEAWRVRDSRRAGGRAVVGRELMTVGSGPQGMWSPWCRQMKWALE